LKKSFICARIVETFLDPLYNTKVLQSDQWNLNKRQNIAEILNRVVLLCKQTGLIDLAKKGENTLKKYSDSKAIR